MIKRKISLVAWILVIGFVATQLFAGTALGDDYGSPILKLTKSVSPSNITDNGTATIKITVNNIGNGNAKDINISDKIPNGFVLESGTPYRECTKSDEYCTMKPNESREFAYKIKEISSSGSGSGFITDSATITYKDEKGFLISSASNNVIINIVEPKNEKASGFEASILAIGVFIALAYRKK